MTKPTHSGITMTALDSPAMRVLSSGEIVDGDAIAIGALYQRSNSSLADAVMARLECGQRLAEKKASMKHGEWLPWLESNAGALGFSTRATAARLIKAAGANVKPALHLDESAALKLSRQMWGHEIKQIAKELRGEEQAEKRAHSATRARQFSLSEGAAP